MNSAEFLKQLEEGGFNPTPTTGPVAADPAAAATTPPGMIPVPEILSTVPSGQTQQPMDLGSRLMNYGRSAPAAKAPAVGDSTNDFMLKLEDDAARFDEQYPFMTRQLNRSAKGYLDKQTDTANEEIIKLTSLRMRLEADEPGVEGYAIPRSSGNDWIDSVRQYLGTDKQFYKPSQLDRMDPDAYQSWKQEALGRINQRLSELRNEEATAQEAKKAIPENPVMRALQEADQAGNQELVNKIIAAHPGTAIAEAFVPSVSQAGFEQVLVPAAAGVGAKMLTASNAGLRAGYLAGSTGVSANVEYKASMQQYLQDQGIKPGDQVGMEKLLKDPKKVVEMKEFAKDRAEVIAAFDLLGAYTATAKIPPVLKKKILDKIFGGTVQMGAQIATEGMGEAGAQLRTTGEINPLDVKLEMLGAGPTAATEIFTYKVTEALGEKAGKILSIKDVFTALEADPTLTVEEALGALIENMPEAPTDQELNTLFAKFGISADEAGLSMTNGHAAGNMSQNYHTAIRDEAYRNSTFTDKNGDVYTGAEVLDSGVGTGVMWSDNFGEIQSSEGRRLFEAEQDVIDAQAMYDLAVMIDPQSVIDVAAAQLENAKQQLLRVQERQKTMAELRPKLKEMLQGIADKFMPGKRIMVLEDSAFLDNKAGAFGSAFTDSRDGRTVGTLVLNVDQMVQALKEGNSSVAIRQDTVTAVALHEMSHLIFQHYSAALKNALDPQAEAAVQAAYRTFLKDALTRYSDKQNKKTLGDFLAERGHPALAALFGEMMPLLKSNQDLSYMFSFKEFVADSLAGASGRITNPISKTLQKYLGPLANIMRQVYETVIKPNYPAQTMDNFYTYLEARAKLGTINELKGLFDPDEMNNPFESVQEPLIQMLGEKGLKLPPDIVKRLKSDKDTYNTWVKYGLTLLQLGKENKHIPSVQEYIKAVHQHWVTKSQWNDQAMETLKAWKKLGKKADVLGRFMLELTVESTKQEKKLNSDELLAFYESRDYDFGKNPEAVWEVFTRLQGDMENVLSEMESIERERIINDYVDNPVQQQAKLQESQKLYAQLRNRDYFPLSRFGNYSLTVRAKKATEVDGVKYKAGQVIHFEMYENERAQKKDLGKLQREFGSNWTVEPRKIPEDMKPFQGLPVQMLRLILQDPKMHLTDEQKATLQQMIDNMSPTNSIAKRMLHRKGTAGFSMDAQRGYSNYMLAVSSHIAKMRHAGQMDNALERLKAGAEQMAAEGVSNNKRMDIYNHLLRHKDYIMNPSNEWAGLRTVGFVWFLGFNAKSAFINLSQVPLVAYPYFAARKELRGGVPVLSDAKVMGAISKAMKDISLSYTRHGGNISAFESSILDALREEGIIDESLATELANNAHSNMLEKMLPADSRIGEKAKAGGRALVGASTYMFQAAEKFNRRITALTAIRLAKAAGLSDAQVLVEAREALRSTQFEYARWNRAAFMRGKASVMFLFMQYLQNILYFTTRDPGKWRYLGMLLIAAGLQGLPGAEDLMDIFDYGKSWWMRATGKKNPYSDIRADLRDFAIQLGLQPEMVMHGTASQSFGLNQLLGDEFMGGKFPNISMDTSLNMGRIIPGLSLALNETGLTQGDVVSGTKDILGAAYSLPVSLLMAWKDPDVNTTRVLTQVMPTALKNITEAAQWYSKGYATDRRGDKLVEMDRENPQHMMELMSKALGFQPSRVQFRREQDFMAAEAEEYYKSLRDRMSRTMLEAYRAGDDETWKAALDQYDLHRKTVPGYLANTTWPKYLINRLMEEQKKQYGIPRRKLDQPLRQEYGARFTEELVK